MPAFSDRGRGFHHKFFDRVRCKFSLSHCLGRRVWRVNLSFSDVYGIEFFFFFLPQIYVLMHYCQGVHVTMVTRPCKGGVSTLTSRSSVFTKVSKEPIIYSLILRQSQKVFAFDLINQAREKRKKKKISGLGYDRFMNTTLYKFFVVLINPTQTRLINWLKSLIQCSYKMPKRNNLLSAKRPCLRIPSDKERKQLRRRSWQQRNENRRKRR